MGGVVKRASAGARCGSTSLLLGVIYREAEEVEETTVNTNNSYADRPPWNLEGAVRAEKEGAFPAAKSSSSGDNRRNSTRRGFTVESGYVSGTSSLRTASSGRDSLWRPTTAATDTEGIGRRSYTMLHYTIVQA